MKKIYRFSIISLIFSMIFVFSFTFGCAPPSEPAEESVMNISEEEAGASTESTMNFTHEEAIPPTDMSCLIGYWEVENESLKNSANSILNVNNAAVDIIDIDGSVVYAFYSLEDSPTPYRMEVWLDALYIWSVARDMNLEIALGSWYSADASLESPGQIYCTPIPEDTHIVVARLLINRQPFSFDDQFDISDFIDPNYGRAISFRCYGGNRISLQYVVGGGEPFYLRATTARAHIGG